MRTISIVLPQVVVWAAFPACRHAVAGADAPMQSPSVRVPCLDLAGRCVGQPGVFRLSGHESNLPAGELRGAAEALADADVIGLGEAAHGSAGFIGIKIRLTRYLIEHHGFRVVAWESPRVAARKLDAYVQSCRGNLEQAVTSLHAYWADVQTRDFAVWLCRWNQAHPSDRVQVHGYDVQDAEADRAELERLLSWTHARPGSGQHARKKWRPAARYLGALSTCDQGHDDLCSAALKALDRGLSSNPPERNQLEERRAWAEARLAFTGYAAGHMMRMISDEARSFEVRARAMARVFLALRELYFHDKKAVLWAHNIHVIKQHPRVIWSWLGAPIISMGTELERRLGADSYRAVAVLGHEIWLNRGRLRGRAEPAPGPDSVELMLHELRWPGLILDLRHPNASAVVPLYQPFQIGAPGAEVHVPAENYDALIYLERSPLAELL